MHCTHCGYTTTGKPDSCPRCRASLTKSNRTRSAVITLALVVLSLAFVSVLVYVVLGWHDAQSPARMLPNTSRIASQLLKEVPRGM